MEETIFEQIVNEIDEFENREIKLSPTCTFNQKDTIDRIINYNNSKFLDGSDIDHDGLKRYFFNITYSRRKNATKAIDLDTKDFMFVGEDGEDYYPVWFFEKEFKQWVKEKGYGKFLNKIVDDLPTYGSVVVKKLTKYSNDARDMIVDLRNLYNEQSAPTLKKATYVIEKHNYTPSEFKKNKWDNMDEVLNDFYSREEGKYIEVYERYGEVPENWIYENGDPNNYVLSVFIVYFYEGSKDGIILFYDAIDEIPYEECHFDKIDGRWLGRGIIESLFDVQVKKNEITNLYGKGLWWNSLKIYQTQDETIKRNLLQEVSNGDVISTRSPIAPIANEERNLSSYIQEDAKWERLADQITFSYAPITGERLPSGTPLGSAVLQSQAAQSFFDYIRENIGLFLKDIIWNLIIPQFKQEKYEDHIINLKVLSPEEIAKIDKIVENYEYNKRLLSIIGQGKLPTYKDAETVRAVVRSALQQNKNRYVEIPEGFYDSLKMKMDIVITGENIDTAAKMTTLQVALQMLSSNPMIVKDAQTKKVFYKLLELAGLNPADIEVLPDEAPPEEELMRTLPQGGSIALPPTPTGQTVPPVVEQNQQI